MSTLSAPATPTPTGLLDPSKSAEYPILLGDKLLGKDGAKDERFINISYNHKRQSPATPQQKAVITRSSTSPDIYNLTITDKSGNANQNTLEYAYKGSVDPSLPLRESETRNLVLVFDPKRKAFILEPVNTNLHFNLHSAPGQSKQALEKYPQLSTLNEDDQSSKEESDDDNPEAADNDNPYDFRHFLPKPNAEKDRLAVSTVGTPNPHSVSSRVNTPTLPSTKTTKAKPLPAKSKPQTNPLRQPKRAPKSTKGSTVPKSQPKSAPRVLPEDIASDSDNDREERQNKPEASPSSNVVYDGDLIIDLGSPPSLPSFKIDPAQFSSNNSSANEADDDEDDEEEDIEDLRLPSPSHNTTGGNVDVGMAASEEEAEDVDALEAEMEAAFEEEEARTRQSQQYTAPSDDESEVSEEE